MAEGSYLWGDRAESKGEKRTMGGGEASELLKAHVWLSVAWLDEPLSRYSVSIQSVNQWFLIRFRGVTALFLFVVTPPPPRPLRDVSLLPSDKGTTSLEKRKTETRRQEPGEGIIERRCQGCCFSSSRCVLLRLLWCTFVLLCINLVCVCVCVSMGQNWMCSPGTQFVKYQHGVSALQWNQIFCEIFFFFCSF